MEYTSLGRGGPPVSRIAFGCAAIGGGDYGPADDGESIRAILTAIDAGISLFDVADVYGFGHAEQVLGNALRGRSDGMIVATKGGVRWDDSGRTSRDSSPEWISKAIDGSLSRLGVSCIDLYQMHWPDPGTPIEDTLGLLERRRQEGKIRFIGCSNFPLKLVERAQQSAPIRSAQLELNLLQRGSLPTLRSCASDHGMLTMTYSSLAHGLLSGKFSQPPTFVDRDVRARSPLFQPSQWSANVRRIERVRAVGERLQKSCAEVALRWVLEQPGVGVAVAGIRSSAQARQNSAATDWTLSSDDLQFLDGSVPSDPCMQQGPA